MKFSHSAALTVASRVSAVALMGVASILIARVLGPAGQGLIASLTASVGIILQFGNLGVYAANIRFVGANRKLFSKAAANSLSLGLSLGFLSFLLLYASTVFFPQAFGGIPLNYLLVYALSIPFSLLIVLFQGLILAVEKIRVYNFFILARALIVLTGSAAILLVFDGGVFELVLLLVFVEVVVCLMYVRSAQGVGKIGVGLDKKLLGDMVFYGLRVYVATQMTYLVLKFDILLVNYYLGLTSAGVYSVSAKIADLLYLAPATVALIYFPRATALKKKARPFTNKVLWRLAVIMAVGCAAAYLFAEPAINLLYTNQYAGAVKPLRILVPGIFFISLETVLMNYYASKKMPLFAVVTPIIGLAANIILNAILIPKHGINGAATSSTIAYTLMFIMLLAYYLKK